MVKKLRVLLLGYGSIGRRHHANLGALAPAKVVVVDPAAPPGAPGPDAELASGLDEVDGSFDLALVCTPTNLHESQLSACLERARFVFVEKPVFDRLPSPLPAEFAREGRRVMVGCNYRYERGLLKVKELLDKGAVGPVVHAAAEYGHYLPNWRPANDYRNDYSAHRSRGGGIILDRIHELDYLYWLFGPARQVMGLQGKRSSLEIDSEDTADFLIHFESGPMASVHLDYLQRVYTCSLKIVGDRGSILWTYNPGRVELIDGSGHSECLYHEPETDVNDMYVRQMRAVLDVVRGEAEPANTLDEALEVLALALAVREGPCL